MELLFTADWHLFDPEVMCTSNRPFSNINNMNNDIIAGITACVNEDDSLYILGDIGRPNCMLSSKENDIIDRKFDNIEKITRNIPCKTILIMGNHDSEWFGTKNLENLFDEVITGPVIINEYLVLSHEPPMFIQDNTPYFYIYGHVHNSEHFKTITKHSACVCVDRWSYRPVSLTTLKKKREEL